MRGKPQRQVAIMMSTDPESLIPAGHPIRKIRKVVDTVMARLDGDFAAMYATGGRPSIPPEQLLKSAVLMALYSIRSERAFCERLNYDMLFKWFLDLPIDARSFDASTFAKNRQRLLDQQIARRFFAEVVTHAKLRRYLSSDHFSVDGTLLEAWASIKSFKANDGPPADPPAGRNSEVNFHGHKRSNDTHTSTTDPESRLARKSNATAAKLCFAGHLLMENRNALIIDMELNLPSGFAERDAALAMLDRLPKRKRRRTLAADKAYDVKGFVGELRDRRVTPHVAPNTKRTSAIDGRTTRHAGHGVSQRIRKRIEEPFGWMKTIAGGRKLRYIGRRRNEDWFLTAGATYNILRITALDTAN
jgi:transposase